jgi:hypothetical protein
MSRPANEITGSLARLESIPLLTYEEMFLALDRATMLLDREIDVFPKETVGSVRVQLTIATRLLERLLTESGASSILRERLLERRKSRQLAGFVEAGARRR